MDGGRREGVGMREMLGCNAHVPPKQMLIGMNNEIHLFCARKKRDT